MKKWLLAGLLMIMASPLSAQITKRYGGSPSDTGIAFRGFGVQLAAFNIVYDKIALNLELLTRGTNDSLTVTLQTKNTGDDTTSYRTLKQFLNLLAVADTSWSFGILNNPADTLRRVGTFARIMINHGNNAAGALAADSSRFRLLVRQWGTPIGR